MYKIAVIGYGYWGPNIVRNFNNHPLCEVSYICDIDAKNKSRARKEYPHKLIIDDPEIIFNDNNIDVVAIVTPVSTHYTLAKKTLLSGKHLFIEKPMVESVIKAKELIDLANQNKLIAVVDHTFLFTDAIVKIKEIIDSGEIGEISYFDSTRVNLGNFQHDVDVIWDLAPHDLSILFYLSNQKPKDIIASGTDHLNNGLVDIAYLTLSYDSKMIANFHLNWLSPIKIRRIIIGGTKKMILFDDLKVTEKIKIYDKGIDIIEDQDEIHNLLINYRSGDVISPNISNSEALKVEINEFINHIDSKSNVLLKNDLTHGRKVVEILEAAKKSLNSNKRISI